MSDPFPTTETPSQALDYQPISAWAIVGFGLGAGFALLVVLCAIVSFLQGAPFFLYNWLIGLAAVGVFVSLYAHRQVRLSEGTKAGAKLAQWGFGLSLVSGLLYVVYYLVTGYAIVTQANAFVMEDGEEAGFFVRLRAAADSPGELDKAFLLTQPPSGRSGKPGNEISMRKSHDIGKDGTSGFLTQFRELALLPRILYKQLGKDAEITPKGVQSWRYAKRSYTVERVYHIKTKELELDYLLVVYSAEGESAGQGRKWFVNLRESHEIGESVKPTPIYEGVTRLRKQAGDYLTKRFDQLKEEPIDIKLDTTPWEALAPREAAARKTRMYLALAGGGSERPHGLQLPKEQPADMPGKWEQVDGRVRVFLIFRGALTRSPMEPPSFQFEGIATLETTRAVDPAKFTPDSVSSWELKAVNFTAMMAPEEKKLPTPKQP